MSIDAFLDTTDMISWCPVCRHVCHVQESDLYLPATPNSPVPKYNVHCTECGCNFYASADLTGHLTVSVASPSTVKSVTLPKPMKFQQLQAEQWLDYHGDPNPCYPKKAADEAIAELVSFGKESVNRYDELLEQSNAKAEEYRSTIHRLEEENHNLRVNTASELAVKLFPMDDDRYCDQEQIILLVDGFLYAACYESSRYWFYLFNHSNFEGHNGLENHIMLDDERLQGWCHCDLLRPKETNADAE